MTFETHSTETVPACRTTQIYCRPDCPAGQRVKAENRVYFQSSEQARANGYRACQVCHPDDPVAAPETFFQARYHSPLGPYTLVSSPRGIVCAATGDEANSRLHRWRRNGVYIQSGGGFIATVAHQLDEYFAGRLLQFNVPLDLRGTSFQRQVWELLRPIPYGETRSYFQIAQALGRPTATRAVGQAIGSNPVAIVVPCHRVIGAHGGLTGYAGGLGRKQALLDLEAAVRRHKAA